MIAISSSAVITCHRVLLLLYDFVVSGKVLRLLTRQCSIACSEAEASSSSLLVIIYFQHLVSFFFSFVLQVSLSLGVVPSRVEFFPPASILMSPSCLLTQHVTRGAASVAGCMCICMQLRVPGWCLGLWGSWARGVLCGRARRSALRAPSLRWSRLRIAVVRLSRPPPVGNPARAPQCWSAAPVQCSARAGLQVARTCPKMPAAGVLKAYCQGGLLPIPRPSCWGLHVRGPMGKMPLTRLVYHDN